MPRKSCENWVLGDERVRQGSGPGLREIGSRTSVLLAGTAIMRSRWSDQEAAQFVDTYGAAWGEALALRTYAEPAARRGARPGAARRRQHLGEGARGARAGRGRAGDLRQGVGVRHGRHRAGGPSRARPRITCAGCARSTAGRRRDGERVPARTASTPSSPSPSIEALVHAFLPAPVHRSHPRRRHPRAHQPAGRPRARARGAGRRRDRAGLRRAGVRTGQGRGRSPCRAAPRRRPWCGCTTAS